VWCVDKLEGASRAFLALPSGHQLYAREDDRCDVAEPMSENVREDNALWKFDGRLLTLPDRRTLYATQDGWANVAAFGQDGNIDDANRVWKIVDGVLTLSDGRQLYTSAGGAGMGKLNQYSNTSTDRRVFKFVEHGGQRPVSPLTVLTDLSRWEVIEGHCFNTHFPVNSGGVHTEKEMEFVRHECLK